MPRALRNYVLEEAEVIGAWYASLPREKEPLARTEEEIVARARCTTKVAYRVAWLRRVGSLRVLSFWLDGARSGAAGRLTLRMAETVIQTDPCDEEAQLVSAARQSSYVRQRLKEERGL